MKKIKKTLLGLTAIMVLLVSLFGLSSCKLFKKGGETDDENGIIVVSEEVFNKNVSVIAGKMPRFSVSKLSEFDEKYVVEGKKYYALAFAKDVRMNGMSIDVSGGSISEGQIYINNKDTSERLEIKEEKNQYTGAVYAEVQNIGSDSKTDYYVAFGFTLYKGFGEEISVRVDFYRTENGSEEWEDGISCQKQAAYRKHVKAESSLKFISEIDYKSGDIDGNLKDSLSMVVGEKYYAVIDYVLSAPVGLTEDDVAYIQIDVFDPEAEWKNGELLTHDFTFDVEALPTSSYEKGLRRIDASFSLALPEEGTESYRFIISIQPKNNVKVNVNAKIFGDKISFVIGNKLEGSISTSESETVERELEYQLSSDGSYYTVVGLGKENRDRVTVPESYKGIAVKEIADDTFSGVKYLKEVKLPTGLQKIGRNAFAGCTELKFIIIPSTVSVVSENAFDNCELDIYYDGGKMPTGWHDSFNPEDLPVYLDCRKSRGEFTFTLNSDGISYTVSGKNCNGKRIIIPAVYGDYPVTRVAVGLYNFIGITLPASIDSVETDALKNTDNLTYANISVNAIDLIKKDKLQELEIRGKTVPSGAFKNCTTLTSVTFSDRVKEIGENAFYGCSSLLAVNFGNSVQNIGNKAFYGCKKVSSLNFPDSLNKIGDHAFSGCSSLKKAVIGNNVTSLGKYAFEYCSSLKEIDLGTGIKVIPEGAFQYATSLNLFTVPSHITAIDKHAFYGCHGLVSVDITKVWLDYIGEKAFYDCISLIEVVQEYNYVTKGSTQNGYLGYYAEGIHQTSCIEKQGDYLFYVYEADITKLTRYLVKYAGEGGYITLPESYNGLSYPIFKYAFYDIDTVRDVIVKGKVTEIGEKAFYDCDKIGEVSISGDVQSIGKYAFYSCDTLFRVELKENVQTVSDSAFEDCKTLYTVMLGDSVVTVSDRAFFGCSDLFKIYFGSSYLESSLTGLDLSYIGVSAFEGCTSLQGVIDLPGSVLKIYDRAFAGCTGITEIKIKNIVDTIGSEVFDGCTSLQKITVSEYNPYYMSEDGVLYCIKNGKELVKYPEGKTA